MVLENRLIGAILIQAIKDWQQPTLREDVKEFLDTRWFAELTAALDLDQETLRKKLLAGEVQNQAIRAAYRKRYQS